MGEGEAGYKKLKSKGVLNVFKDFYIKTPFRQGEINRVYSFVAWGGVLQIVNKLNHRQNNKKLKFKTIVLRQDPPLCKKTGDPFKYPPPPLRHLKNGVLFI